jgi:GNAT superfamily N-acetyltransferase
MRFAEYGADNRDDLIALADAVLGKGFFGNPSKVGRSSNSCVLVALDKDDTLVGFIRGRLLGADGLQSFLENRLPEIPEDIAEANAEGTLGVIETVVVDPGHQRQGIGTKLLMVIHDTIIGLGADKLIVTFKRGPREGYVDKLMEKLDFQYWTRLPTYWQERCERGEFICAGRDEKCNCEAVLYRKKVF